MKKRILLLAAALCLLLSGCGGGLLEREWSSVTPHSAGYWENGDKDTLRADSYQDAVNAILMLVANHAERGVVRCYSGSEFHRALAEFAAAQAQLDSVKTELDSAKAAFDKAARDIAESEVRLADGRRQLEDGEAALEDARAQLEQGEADYEQGRRDADEQLEDAKRQLDDAQRDIDGLGEPEWMVLDRSSNAGYVSFEGNAENVAAIAQVFPIFFFLVAALVALTPAASVSAAGRSSLPGRSL